MWSETIYEIVKLFNNLFISPRKQIRKVVNIYDAMHKIMEGRAVERILILKAHNGGGVVRPHTPLYISALYEDYSYPFESVRDSYQKLDIDEEGLRMLSELCIKKSIYIRTSSLKKGMIKRIYEGEGIKYAELYYLGQDRRNIYYCSLATSQEETWEHDSYQRNEISISVNKIKNNIR